MSHPRVEEVSDSDVDMSDPSEGDIDDFVESDIMRRVHDSKKPPSQPPQPQSFSRPLPSVAQGGLPQVQMRTTTDEKAYKSYQCLYPVYFDATRTRAEGRRVPRSLAVANPLAIDIVQACAQLRLQTVLEAGKLHPKDWANPGRVKVNLRGDNQPGSGSQLVKNKHHLYVLVAKHLRANPTTDDSPALRMRVGGAPPPPQVEPGKPWPRPAVPRGWKMGELLPYYSPAMTGGGVSENFLKDMMKEMQAAGGGAGGMPDMASLLAAAGAGGGSGAAGGAGGGGGKKEKKGKGK
ncbi:signal recognition particle, SRP19 subunit [Chaetomium strumarium]|uniref:Signal recognition particle, SRP19 subunit n=1 Tax=Chaetomium strumarium TaxID=1170767 RepID=A0AAJ0GQ50_9PEZI|nr:signal recognition particle, SRP19 subunit [Chaetomium strumarium]